MIRYTLRCEQDHAFESWFQSSSAYDQQVKRKLVSCPACGSTKVERRSWRRGSSARRAASGAPSPAQCPRKYAAAGIAPSLMMAQERELRAKIKELRDHS